jgi:Ca-activated chloride channel family protein
MTIWHRRCGPALVLAAALGAFGPAAAQGNEPASVIVVFDGSGSMWGNIEGTRASKLVLARDALRRALGRIDPQTRVGLSSFGHRRGDCVDVEVLRQPEPVDVPRIMEHLERLNPRGRGPLTLALREAAKSLPASGRRTLVLVNDEADNCQQNVCAIAQELRAARITTHVVGLGLRPDDAAKMACLPQMTGGRLVNALNSEQVTAGVEEVLRLAVGAAPRPGPGAPAEPQASAEPEARATVPAPPADAPPGLYLRALLAPKTAAVALPLNWTVHAEGQPGSVLFFARRAPHPYVALPPGRYVVEARDGPVAASETVEVAASGPTIANLALNAGTLRVRAVAQKTNAPFGEAVITIGDAQGGDAKKESAPLAVLKAGEGQVLLPAGRYLVRVELGLARVERSVVVPAGSQGRIDIPLNAARLQLSAAGRDLTDTAEALTFSIAEDDPPRGRREVARSAGRQAEFVLPPGTYYVTARLGVIEARESLAVGPGDEVKRTLAVPVGRLALATRPVGAAQTLTEPVSYQVQRIDAPTAETITTSRPAPVLTLLAGRYRVEGRYGAMNALTVREVEVKAGQTQQLTLEHQAATLRLRLVGGAGPLTEVSWDIRDENGATVWTTGQPEPQATLQAGRYVVRGETREKRYTRTLDLRAGEARVLELAAD